MGCIYKHTNNITQESYIGYTSRNADKRKREHIRGDGNQPLKDAIDEFGENAFDFEILEDGIINEFLPEREKFWIAKFDTFHNGYNCTSGGEAFKEHSEETRKKQSESHIGNEGYWKGKTFSPEHRANLSKSHLESNTLRGKPLSSEHKEKISESKKGGKHTEEAKHKMSKTKKGKPIYANRHPMYDTSKVFFYTLPEGMKLSDKRKKVREISGADSSTVRKWTRKWIYESVSGLIAAHYYFTTM